MTSVMIAVKCLVFFGIVTCSMLFLLINDIKRDLKLINENAKHKKYRSKISNQFREFVQFHSKLIQLSCK